MSDENMIVVKVDETCEMASVTLNGKCVMEGNFWDFHNECHGIYEYGHFQSHGSLAVAIRDSIGGTITKTTYEYM